MVGSPEQLDRTAKSRIGAWYLRKLIESLSQPVGIWGSLGTFENVEAATAKVDGIKIPNFLKEMFGLDKLSWQLAGGSRTSTLIIGGNFNPQVKADIESDAFATIEVARRMEIVDGREKPVPLFFRIAGVVSGNEGEEKRIVAATYDLTDPSHPLTELNVSVNHNESSSLRAKAQNPLFRELFQHIFPSFSIEFPYKTAGLITKAMHVPMHFEVLVVKVDNNGNTLNVGRSEETPVQNELYNLALTVGYRVATKYHLPSPTNPHGKSLITVSYNKEDADKRGLSPWEVSIPASLLPLPTKQS